MRFFLFLFFGFNVFNTQSQTDIDTSFQTGIGFNNPVYSIVIQPDEKIIVGGFFETYQGVPAKRIIRLNSDGSRDTSFDMEEGFDNVVYKIVLQEDGKILVGGRFENYQGVPANRIIRLNSDGSRDTSFDMEDGFTTGSSINYIVNSIVLQNDGKIIVGGSFTSYQGASANRIIRLNNDGSRDTSFQINGGLIGDLYDIMIQPDEKIVAAGQFTQYQGVPVRRVVRINPDGSRDTSFDVGNGFPSGILYALAIQSGGKIVIGGDFSTFQDNPAHKIVRLNSDGSRDTSFVTGEWEIDNNNILSISSLYAQADGKILVGGSFTSYNGVPVSRLIRLNNDGSRDESFDVGSGFTSSSNNRVSTLAVQTDGKLLAGGWFFNYKGSQAGCIVRLSTDILSVNEPKQDFVKIYPNPVNNGFLYVVSEENTQKILQIYDASGRKVIDKSVDTELIDISGFQSGVYVVKITINGNIITRKLIVG